MFAQGTSGKKGFPKEKEEGSKASLLTSSSTSKPCVTNVRCKNCGKLGHTSSVCQESKPPAQIHVMSTIDDASVTSEEEIIIILTQFHTYPDGADSDYMFA